MKFDITVVHDPEDGEPWVEDYDRRDIKTLEDANAYATAIVQRFNETLRPGERARKVVRVQITGQSTEQNHDWSKINLVTIIDPRMGMYDLMRCTACGISAKRFGLTNIIIDRQWGAKKYQKCKGVTLSS